MKTLDELYQQMLKRAADGKPVGGDGDPKLIDCLAHPDDQSPDLAGQALSLSAR